MIDDLLKTIILGAPNFVGFIFAIWILNQRLTKQDERMDALIKTLTECFRSEHVNGAKRVFSDERSGASPEEKTEPLTVANEQNLDIKK